MSDFSKGMLSLFRSPEPPDIPTQYEMEKEVWQSVGDVLRFAMNTYEQTEEYQAALKIANQKQRPDHNRTGKAI